MTSLLSVPPVIGGGGGEGGGGGPPPAPPCPLGRRGVGDGVTPIRVRTWHQPAVLPRSSDYRSMERRIRFLLICVGKRAELDG